MRTYEVPATPQTAPEDPNMNPTIARMQRLTAETCTVCGHPVRVSINRGSGFCGELCRKQAKCDIC